MRKPRITPINHAHIVHSKSWNKVEGLAQDCDISNA